MEERDRLAAGCDGDGPRGPDRGVSDSDTDGPDGPNLRAHDYDLGRLSRPAVTAIAAAGRGDAVGRPGRAAPEVAAAAPTIVLYVGMTLNAACERLVRATLEWTGGNVARAAAVLKITAKTIRNRAKIWKIDLNQFR